MTARFIVSWPCDQVFTVTFTEPYAWAAKGSAGWKMNGGFCNNNAAYSNQYPTQGSRGLFDRVLRAVTSLKRLEAVQKRKHRIRIKN
jgi:hypothetical protein